MFIRKRYILLILLCIAVLIAGVFYYREFRSLPDFAVPLMTDIEKPGPNDRVVVFAPHSDDEIVGAGGLIYDSLKNGAKVEVVLITNGDGHIFSTMEDFRKVYPTAQNYIDSGTTRQKESINALKVLGLDEKNIVFLGYPDHGIKELYSTNWKVPYQSPYTKQNSSPYSNSQTKRVSYTGDNLENDIIKVLKDFDPTIVVAPYKYDIHPDHAASYQFIQRAIKDSQDESINRELLYLVHYRRFPYPGGLRKDRFIAPPAKLVDISVEWEKLAIDSPALEAKSQALKQYTSQLGVPTLKGLLESFLRQNELFAIQSSQQTSDEADNGSNN